MTLRQRFARAFTTTAVALAASCAAFAQQLPHAPLPTNTPAPAPQPFSSSSTTPAAPTPPRFWSSPDPTAQVTVLENTMLRVMTDQPISTRQTRAGAPLTFTLTQDVIVDGVLIIARGATIHGTVVESRQAGALTGRPGLVLKITALDLPGRSYPLYTYPAKIEGASKSQPAQAKVRDGAIIGAIVGGVMSGSAKGETTGVGKLAGAGTGAAIGAGVGVAASAATPGPILSIPAESQIDFYLAAPISVVPVTEKEAAKLSQGLHPGGPVLYVRTDTP